MTRVSLHSLPCLLFAHETQAAWAGVISQRVIPFAIVTNTRNTVSLPAHFRTRPDTRVEHDVGFRSERFHDRRVHVRSRASPDPPRPHRQGECPIRISIAHIPRHARSIARTLTDQPSVRRLQASGRVSLRVQAIAEGRQSLFVAVTVKSGKMEEYEKLIKRHSESSQPTPSIVSNPTNAQV